MSERTSDPPGATRALPERWPVVSVVIPTYNRAALLREAVDSVMRQTFADWELIVADDGSTDNTLDYLAELNDPRVRTLGLAHAGNMALMRNAAVAEARGEWVAFLDSDDLWMPEKLELQLGRLRANPRCDWSCTGFTFIDGTGQPIPPRSGQPYEPRSGWILERLVTFSAITTVQSLMVRRTVLDDMHGFDEQFLTRADYDLELRLAARSEICALAEALTIIREHDGRMTSAERVVTLLKENERVFRKAVSGAPNATVRALCRRQCAMQLLRAAQLHWEDGAHRDAVASVRRAVADDAFSPLVWRAVAGVAMRSAGAFFRKLIR